MWILVSIFSFESETRSTYKELCIGDLSSNAHYRSWAGRAGGLDGRAGGVVQPSTCGVNGKLVKFQAQESCSEGSKASEEYGE